MIKRVYAVYDLATKSYGDPAFISNDRDAIDAFSHHVNTAGTMMNKFPDDHTLYRLGSYDSESGSFAGFEKTIVTTARKELKNEK